MQWDNLAEMPNESTSTNKGMICSVDCSVSAEAKIAALIRRIEALQTTSAS